MSNLVSEGETFLEHYGKKGMKWGRRKGKVAGPRPYNTKNMSNAELKKVINRMQLEQNYRDLNRKARSSGKKFATEITTNQGKKVATQLLTAVTTAGITYGAMKLSPRLPAIKDAILKAI